MKPKTLAEEIRDISEKAGNRLDFWADIINLKQCRTVVELGVFSGTFSAHILKTCECIRNYIMIDPWRNLPDWNKPANITDDQFERIYREAMDCTHFAKDKVTVLRGRTIDVIGKIENCSVDLVYIDGDHTLRGITNDLISVLPKVKTGGIIGGDDFTPSIWQHDKKFEPTFVFPFAVYFSEAVGMEIFATKYNQFLINNSASRNFDFVDLTGMYGDVSVLSQFSDT